MPENKEVRKLELCDIAPYAPFDLQVKILNHERDSVGIEESVMTGYYFLGDSLHITYKGGDTGKSVNEFKPYLRSLDQLTQEITHGGKTFIPIIELFCIRYGRNGFEILELKSDSVCHTLAVAWDKARSMIDNFYYNRVDMHFGFHSSKGNHHRTPFQYQMFQKLAEWHFDFQRDSLIDSGLAIPTHNTK